MMKKQKQSSGNDKFIFEQDGMSISMSVDAEAGQLAKIENDSENGNDGSEMDDEGDVDGSELQSVSMVVNTSAGASFKRRSDEVEVNENEEPTPRTSKRVRGRPRKIDTVPVESGSGRGTASKQFKPSRRGSVSWGNKLPGAAGEGEISKLGGRGVRGGGSRTGGDRSRDAPNTSSTSTSTNSMSRRGGKMKKDMSKPDDKRNDQCPICFNFYANLRSHMDSAHGDPAHCASCFQHYQSAQTACASKHFDRCKLMDIPKPRETSPVGPGPSRSKRPVGKGKYRKSPFGKRQSKPRVNINVMYGKKCFFTTCNKVYKYYEEMVNHLETMHKEIIHVNVDAQDYLQTQKIKRCPDCIKKGSGSSSLQANAEDSLHDHELPVLPARTATSVHTNAAPPSNEVLNFSHSHPLVSLNRMIFEEGLKSDVTIVAKDNVEIKSHKCFLSASSPVLRAMFQNSEEGQVRMTDFSEDVVKAFLRFIYFRDLEQVRGNVGLAFELFKIAEKYDVQSVKEEMSKILLEVQDGLINVINVELAFKMYLFARNIESAGGLRAKARGLLKTNFREVGALQDYEDLFIKNPKVAMEVMGELWNSS